MSDTKGEHNDEGAQRREGEKQRQEEKERDREREKRQKGVVSREAEVVGVRGSDSGRAEARRNKNQAGWYNQ